MNPAVIQSELATLICKLEGKYVVVLLEPGGDHQERTEPIWL